MPDGYVTHETCEALCKGLAEEDKRQNHRLDELDKQVEEIHKLSQSTERLTVIMEQMLQEQRKQGDKIEKLEKRDGEKWRKLVETFITVIVSGVIGFALAHIGF